jgi:hypothetical protein
MVTSMPIRLVISVAVTSGQTPKRPFSGTQEPPVAIYLVAFYVLML